MEVIDIDQQSNELIDIFPIDIPPIGAGALTPGHSSTSQGYIGVFGIASIAIGLQLVCQPGFSGDSCQAVACAGDTCSNGGTCVPDGANFVCLCPSGYTGQLCQTGLDGSIVICGSIGICLHSGGDDVVGVVLGSMVGGLVLVVILVGIVIIVALLCIHFTRQSMDHHVITSPEGIYIIV